MNGTRITPIPYAETMRILREGRSAKLGRAPDADSEDGESYWVITDKGRKTLLDRRFGEDT